MVFSAAKVFVNEAHCFWMRTAGRHGSPIQEIRAS
uniref:Uncharacterized protein n=1 Tax=Anguilla anguilla TaxID=7936 RepID=A0A0E9TAE4_ANGAN